jgi:hypothetical protein
MQLLGLNVSRAEMKELLAEVDRDGSGADLAYCLVRLHAPGWLPIRQR